MKRNLVRKRKCKPLPGNSGLSAATRTASLTSPHTDETLTGRTSGKGGTIKRRVILSLSNDLEFDRRLRMAALQRGQIVIRVESVESALRIVHTECSGVILLDLDFAGKAAWELAGGLLQESKCPPVILLTGQGKQFDLRMAVMAGSIFEKSGNADHVLNIVSELLEASLSEQAGRAMGQRGMVRRFAPSGQPAPLIPTHRFWGINE